MREAWNGIMAGAGADALCNAYDWSELYIKAYVPTSDLFGWKLTNTDGAPIGILSFRYEPRRTPFALRRVLFAVDGSFDSDYLDFPAKRGFEAIVARAALDLLIAERDAEAVVLSCIPNNSETLTILRGETARRNLTRREISVPCSIAPLPSTFEDYLKQLKPRVRSKVRQALRLGEENKAVYKWCHEVGTIHEHLELLYQLHGKRWNASGQPGSFIDVRRRHFYNTLAPAFLASNRLRFARLEIEGQPVAYQIGALANNVYYQLQEGFDINFSERRVATTLRALVIRDLIAEGISGYDFMAGESQHKSDWGAEARPCTTFAFPLPRIRARAAYGARAVFDWWNQRSAAPSPSTSESHNENAAGRES
ncbi:MAG: GNAT family N-acetyltransferase [Planctomycetota bacterium]